MKSRKISTILASMITGAVLLSACGGSSSNSAQSSGSSAPAAEESKEETAESTEQAAAPAAGAETWNIGTSSSGSFYYFGTAIAQVVTPVLSGDGLTVVSEATNGSVENARRLNSGELKMAICAQTSVDDELANGNIQAENLTYIMPLYENIAHFATPVSTGWNTLDDAMHAGVKVGVGEPGSGYYLAWEQFFDMYGMTIDDAAAQRISTAEQIDLMIDGGLELVRVDGGIPNSNISNLASSMNGGVKLLNMSQENMDAYNEYVPYFYLTTIPGGTYEGTPDDTTTMAYKPLLYCRADLDEELVYQFTKAMCENTADMAAIYEPCGEVSAEAAVEMMDVYTANGVQMHPGALRYFQEVGAIK